MGIGVDEISEEAAAAAAVGADVDAWHEGEEEEEDVVAALAASPGKHTFNTASLTRRFE